MMKGVVVAAFGACILFATTDALLAGDTLTGGEIRKFVAGRAKAKINGTTVTSRMSHKGRLSAKWGDERDTGNWHVSGDQLCIKFRNWLNGSKRCSAVIRSGIAYQVAGVAFTKY